MRSLRIKRYNGTGRSAVLDRRASTRSIVCTSNGGLRSRLINGSQPRATYLTAQLEESASYLRNSGWQQTAVLLLAAAAEIESLRRELGENHDD